MSYIPRAIKDKLLRISDSFPVVSVTGPRQVGKTTLLQRMSDANRKYVTSETLEAGNMSGAILETFVVSEIIKSYYNSGDTPRLASAGNNEVRTPGAARRRSMNESLRSHIAAYGRRFEP